MSTVLAEIASGAAGGLLGGIKSILNTFVADKSEQAKETAELALQDLVAAHSEAQAQIAVDQAEASSPDRINHWRGALGWTCDAAIAWHFILMPFFQYVHAVLVAWGWSGKLPPIPDVDQMPLMQLVLLMLGSHAVPAITNAVASLKK